ncbi:MAG: sensor histidine kinase [Bellilinea sp.]
MAEVKQPLTPEILVPRLGDYLVEQKLITPDQLTYALQQQAAIRKSQPTTPLLGQILVDLGILDRAALDQAITEQVLQLRAALTENNQLLERRVQERTSELEKALERLSELNQLKSNFLANISHELRTPLTHLKGYIELLRTGDLGVLTPEQATALETIQRSTDRLGRLIEDLILFSTSERAQLTIVLDALSLDELCADVVNQMNAKAADQMVNLEFLPLPKAEMVYADREKIGWVVYQFIDNAVKFTPSGGSVAIELIPDGDHIKLQVSDTGIGIPPNRIREIFEPFHQLDSSSTRKYGGTGLGLSLAQKIMEAHNSSIQVISELGKGSQFSFKLKRVVRGQVE